MLAALTTYYTLSAPGGMVKSIRTWLTSDKFAFAFHAGVFDNTEAILKDGVGTGERTGITFIVRNQDDIDTLRKKGAVLKDVNELIEMVNKVDVSSVAPYLDLSEAISEYGSLGYSMTNNYGLLTVRMRKKLVHLLPAASPISELIKMLTELETFFSKDEKHVALGALAPASGGAKSRAAFNGLQKRYPLLNMFNPNVDLDATMLESFVAYIIMEEKRIADKEALAAVVAAANKAAADLHAEQAKVLATV